MRQYFGMGKSDFKFGEFLKAKNLNYVQSYIAIGMTTTQIMFRKILPNIFPVIFVQLLFIFSMAIIIESSFSFIFDNF